MDTADKHKRIRWTGAVKGREVFVSNDSLLLDEQKLIKKKDKPISGRVDRASCYWNGRLGFDSRRVIPKTIKIGIHSFPAWRSAIKGTVWSLRRVW